MLFDEKATLEEDLIKPASDIARIFCKDEIVKKLQQIPLSNNKIRAHIIYMSKDIKQQLIDAIKVANIFSIQLDETTDISNDAQLMVYVRYPSEKEMEEDILFCISITTTTTGEIFSFQRRRIELECYGLIGKAFVQD